MTPVTIIVSSLRGIICSLLAIMASAVISAIDSAVDIGRAIWVIASEHHFALVMTIITGSSSRGIDTGAVPVVLGYIENT